MEVAFSWKDEPKFMDKVIRTDMLIAVSKVLNDAVKDAELTEIADWNGQFWEVQDWPMMLKLVVMELDG